MPRAYSEAHEMACFRRLLNGYLQKLASRGPKLDFEKEDFCKNDKKLCNFISIDGSYVKKQILLRNFGLLENYLDYRILKYVKKKLKI